MWQKKGLIFVPNGCPDWMVSYAWVPVVDHVEGNLYRIYFASRNKENFSQIGYILVDINNPADVLEIAKHPVLQLGALGTFDDSGVIPSCIVKHGDQRYLYYVGWMQGRRVPYYASLGLAISEDAGETFHKFSKGPLLERNDIDPYMTASAEVIIEDRVWRMWYLTNTQWIISGGQPKPKYHIKYAESDDGVEWRREGVVAIDFKSEDEYAIARPCVIKENGIYKMWYSYRGDFYRIGYAESEDGTSWERKDREVGVDVSNDGWDSQMIEYAFVIQHKEVKYMFYNGNNYGQTGIGYAVFQENK